MNNLFIKFVLASLVTISMVAFNVTFAQNMSDESDWRKSKEVEDQYKKITAWFDDNKVNKDYLDVMSDKRFIKFEKAYLIERNRAELRFKFNRELILRDWSDEAFTTIHKEQLNKFKDVYLNLSNDQVANIKAEIADYYLTEKIEDEFSSHDHSVKDHDHSEPTPVPEASGDMCTNPDFEIGNFTNWLQYIGTVTTATGPYSFNTPLLTTAFSTINSLPAVGSVPGEHHITTGGIDPISGEPMVHPSGTRSVMLGNGHSGGADASRIVQTFQVDANSEIFSLKYHVVLNNPSSHTAAQQPYFTVRVTDQSGALVTCASYSAYSGDGQPGWLPYFTGSSTTPTGYYLPWTTVLLPLTPYIGQDVTVEVTVGDCTLSGHGGYAYVDFGCNPLDFSLGGVAPCYGPYVLEVPQGAASYNWTTGDSTYQIAVTDTGYYSVDIVPITGSACQITVDTIISGFPVFTALPLITDSLACVNDSVVIYADSSVTSFVHEWTLPNGSTYTGNSITINSVDFGDVGWYSLVTTDTASGCISEPDSLQLQVTSGPTISANDTTVCQGSPASLVGNGGVTYSWINGLLTGNNLSVTPYFTTQYSVIGYDSFGCFDFDTLTVTVIPPANVDITPDTSFCIGNTMTLVASGAQTYVWDNGLTGNGNTQTVAPSDTTEYKVIGTDINGCVDSATMTLTINPLPIVDAGPDQFICENDSAYISGSGAVSYVWNTGVVNGVGFIQTPSTVVHTVTGTDVNGCEQTDFMSLTVHPNPIIDAGPNVVVCESVPVTLSGSGTVSYSWDNGVMDGVAFVQAPSVVLYTVTGTDLNTCQGTDTVLVTVNALPNVDAGADTVVCQFEPYSVFGTGAASYTWNQGITDGVPFYPNQTLVYTVVGTDANGCQNTDSVNIVFETLPQIAFSADSLAGCVPSTVDFVNNTPGNIALCEWSFGDGNTGIGSDTVVHVYTGAGYFDVTLTATSVNGCINSDTYNNYVYVEALPVASFTASPSEMTTLETHVEFTNYSTGAVNYHWNFGDGIGTSTTFSPEHDYPTGYGGNYRSYLVAYNNLGCPDTMFLVVKVKEFIIMYVPNAFTPDGDQFNQTFQPVVTSGVDAQDFTLSVFNRWGELMFVSHDINIGWDGTYKGQLVQDGIYAWKIEYKVKDSEERKIETGQVTLLK